MFVARHPPCLAAGLECLARRAACLANGKRGKRSFQRRTSWAPRIILRARTALLSSPPLGALLKGLEPLWYIFNLGGGGGGGWTGPRGRGPSNPQERERVLDSWRRIPRGRILVDDFPLLDTFSPIFNLPFKEIKSLVPGTFLCVPGADFWYPEPFPINKKSRVPISGTRNHF